MPNLFRKYETDSEKENDGVDITIDGCVFVCRRAGGSNRRYRAAIGQAAASPDFQARYNGTDRVEALKADDELTLQAFADAVVIGWRDVLDRDDQPMEYNKDNFVDLMTACPDIWRELRTAAANVDSYRVEQANTLGEELGKS